MCIIVETSYIIFTNSCKVKEFTFTKHYKTYKNYWVTFGIVSIKKTCYFRYVFMINIGICTYLLVAEKDISILGQYAA
jgi:hypothetical protein